MQAVMMIASEGVPFCQTGGLATFVGETSRALRRIGQAVDVVLPAYRAVHLGGAQRVDRFEVELGGRSHAVTVHLLRREEVCHYFIDVPELFDRPGMYGEGAQTYADNALRFAVFGRAALELAIRVCRPKVIHCHDWQTGLVPVMLRSNLAAEPALAGVKTVFTVHNAAYQGLFDRASLPSLGLDPALFHPEGLEFWGALNFLKAGLVYSDRLTTVSPGYARELQSHEQGCGLEGVFRARSAHLVGILNGVDYAQWNPELDPYIARPYSVADLAGKQACRQALQREFGLPASRDDLPLLATAGRFSAQKGTDFILQMVDFLEREDLQLVVLGMGDPPMEQALREAQRLHPRGIALRLGYDEALAHRVYAGADLLLMPSRFEPCGITQLICLRYGTLPIVRAVGGLDDSVTEHTGFKFTSPHADALQDATHRAVREFRDDPAQWHARVRLAMQQDFSWEATARQYARLYGSLGGAA